MDNTNPVQLPVWHFFHRLEKELSYERWIDKYKLFLHGVTELVRFAGEEGVISGGKEQEFRRFCKFLYLQDHRQEARFDELLDEAIRIETGKWAQWASRQDAPPPPAPTPPPAASGSSAPPPATPTDAEQAPPPPVVPAPDEHGLHPVYFRYGKAFSTDQGSRVTEQPTVPRFLTGDEYFPLTRREMVKSWQYLRFKQKEGYTDRMDIPATVEKIARQGMFTEAVFKTGYINREDAVIILADTRGSMTPFEGLTDRLIETARNEGGHSLAPVFYFQNYPTGYLFKQRNLTKPVKIAEALAAAHPSVTYAIVISDAGAARGTTQTERVQTRTAFTRQFLGELQKYTAKIIWLNPMPTHRWQGTAAEAIAYPPSDARHPAPHVMLSVLDDNHFHFQTALHLLRLANKNTP